MRLLTNRDKTASYNLDTLYRIQHDGIQITADFCIDGMLISGVVLGEYRDERATQNAMNHLLLSIVKGENSQVVVM